MKKLVLMCVALMLSVACTSNKPEDKVAEAIEKNLGKEEYKNKLTNNMDKLMGKEASVFKTSVIDLFVKKTTVEVSDIKVDGTKATAKLRVSTPNEDEFTGLFFMAAFMDQKKLRAMTVNQFINELAKAQRKTASVDDLKIDTFESTVELTDNNGWTINKDSIKNFFNKKNKIKK